MAVYIGTMPKVARPVSSAASAAKAAAAAEAAEAEAEPEVSDETWSRCK